MQSIELRILVGKHAISRYAPELKNTKLSELTQAQNIKFADTLVLPHPSPRNNVWLAKNPDFEATCIPQLQQRIASIM
jgi:uracil-DNA glycosylase